MSHAHWIPPNWWWTTTNALGGKTKLHHTQIHYGGGKLNGKECDFTLVKFPPLFLQHAINHTLINPCTVRKIIAKYFIQEHWTNTKICNWEQCQNLHLISGREGQKQMEYLALSYRFPTCIKANILSCGGWGWEAKALLWLVSHSITYVHNFARSNYYTNLISYWITMRWLCLW